MEQNQIKKVIVSIVIVNWNGKRWLNACIASLQKQTYKAKEIIIVDNASTDASIEYIKKEFPQVRIIQNEKNVGFSKGNNIGIASSLGETILLLNSDTWVKNDFIEKMMNAYQHNIFDVIAPTEKRYDGSRVFSCNTTIDFLGSPAYFSPRNTKNNPFYLSGTCMLFNKDFYYKTKGLDDNFFMYFEDADWFWRLNLLNKKYAYIKDVYVYHAGAGSFESKVTYKKFLWRNQNILQMLLKNYSPPFLCIVLPIYFFQNLIEIFFFLLLLKPTIVYAYIQGWIFNVKHLKIIFKKREWIQRHRKLTDREVIKRMYFGFGKLLMLQAL